MKNEPITAPDHAPVDDEGALGRVARKVLGKNWKTSLAGFLALACGVAPLIPGLPPVVLDVCRVVLPIATGGGLVLAKDKGVSGTGR